jgi:hypothetical protein
LLLQGDSATSRKNKKIAQSLMFYDNEKGTRDSTTS